MKHSARTAILALVVACTLVAFSAPSAASPRQVVTATQAAVSGLVTGSDEQPVAGARIDVCYASKGVYSRVATLITDGGGRWSYGGKAGDYRFDFYVHAAAAPLVVSRLTQEAGVGDEPVSVALTMENKGSYELDEELATYGGIEGRVSDAASNALAGATVAFFRQYPDLSWALEPSATVVTTSDGSYTSPQLETGSWIVNATMPLYRAGYYSTSGTVGSISSASAVLVTQDATTSGVDLHLTGMPGSIGGRVLVYGLPRADTYVWIYRQGDDGVWPPTTPGWGQPTRTVYTDGSGNYTFSDLELGNYKVRFWGGSMIGSQWWQCVRDVSLATVISLSSPGQAVTGIDGVF